MQVLECVSVVEFMNASVFELLKASVFELMNASVVKFMNAMILFSSLCENLISLLLLRLSNTLCT